MGGMDGEQCSLKSRLGTIGSAATMANGTIE